MMIATQYGNLKLSRKVKAELDETMRSWRTVYDAIAVLDDTKPNLERLTDMLVYEVHNGSPRPQLIVRLHMRINRMRQRLEYQDIMARLGIDHTRSPVPNPHIAPPLKKAASKAVKPPMAARKLPPIVAPRSAKRAHA